MVLWGGLMIDNKDKRFVHFVSGFHGLHRILVQY